MYAISGVWWHLPSNDCDLHEQKCEFAPDKKHHKALFTQQSMQENIVFMIVHLGN